MRITLWQQFSSNHSSNFTVVGRFESAEAAQDAAQKFVFMLRKIDEWRDVPENAKWIDEQQHTKDRTGIYPYCPPTLPEVEFSKEYQVDWGDAGIDWIGGNPEERVRLIGQDVLVSVDFETWCPPTPIENLMKKFGGQIYQEISEITHIVVTLNCKLSNPTIAQSLVDEITSEPYRQAAYDGESLTVKIIYWRIGEQFPDLIALLEANGCVDISYNFSQILESDIDNNIALNFRRKGDK